MQRAGLWNAEASDRSVSETFDIKMFSNLHKGGMYQIRFEKKNQGFIVWNCLYPGQNNHFLNNSVGKFAFNGGERWAMWKNGSSQHHWLVCVVNFLLPSAPRSSIDSLLSEARVICITYSPLSLPVASSTVYSERSRPSWIAQLLGHVDSPVHGWALIALVYAGSGCVQSSLLSVP